jgi:gas vesicle protein
MTTTAKVLTGFLAGAAIGTITGILIAPDKGINTRRKIKEESKHLSDDISHTLYALTHPYRDRGKEKDKVKQEDEEIKNGKLERSKMLV